MPKYQWRSCRVEKETYGSVAGSLEVQWEYIEIKEWGHGFDVQGIVRDKVEVKKVDRSGQYLKEQPESSVAKSD